jgi:hypothetical protein
MRTETRVSPSWPGGGPPRPDTLKQTDTRQSRQIVLQTGRAIRFCPRPALNPPLGGDRIHDSLVMLGQNELHGTAHERIAVTGQPLRVLAYSLLDRTASDSRVIAAVHALKDVNRRAIQASAPRERWDRNRQRCDCAIVDSPTAALRPSFETPAPRAPQDEGFPSRRPPSRLLRTRFGERQPFRLAWRARLLGPRTARRSRQTPRASARERGPCPSAAR